MGAAKRKAVGVHTRLNSLKGAELRKALAAIAALYGERAPAVLFAAGLTPLPVMGPHSGVRYAQPIVMR